MESALPLQGIRVLELAGLAPGPFAGMVLSDFGASVVRVDRDTGFNPDVLCRGKNSISVSLKSPEGIKIIQTLLSGTGSAGPSGCSNPGCTCAASKVAQCPSNKSKEGVWRADILIDPFRPGVLERLGLDPQELLRKNPRLIICRLTGFRREGPYGNMAGHDINYLALSGVLSMLGQKDAKPAFPANLLADFGGGGMMAVIGILLALFERTKSGKGQIVEVDMVTGTRYVSSFPLMMSRPSLGLGMWDKPRGENSIDGGSPWYNVYETSDKGNYMSLGAIEPQFYKTFLETLLDALPAHLIPNPPPSTSEQMDRTTWPALFSFLETAFASQPRAFWTDLFLSTDACCVPVLSKSEVDSLGRSEIEPDVNVSELGGRGDGGIPEVAPRLSRTPGISVKEAYGGEFLLRGGKDTKVVLHMAGFKADKIQEWVEKDVVAVLGQPEKKNKAKL